MTAHLKRLVLTIRGHDSVFYNNGLRSSGSSWSNLCALSVPDDDGYVMSGGLWHNGRKGKGQIRADGIE